MCALESSLGSSSDVEALAHRRTQHISPQRTQSIDTPMSTRVRHDKRQRPQSPVCGQHPARMRSTQCHRHSSRRRSLSPAKVITTAFERPQFRSGGGGSAYCFLQFQSAGPPHSVSIPSVAWQSKSITARLDGSTRAPDPPGREATDAPPASWARRARAASAEVAAEPGVIADAPGTRISAAPAVDRSRQSVAGRLSELTRGDPTPSESRQC